ncbi:MAG: DNA repair protein RecO [Steroidobacteraceae bacterium]
MSGARRAALQPAFLLHHSDYSDSSRICRFLTRDHGRVSLFARGARRPGSGLRGVLRPFTHLLVSWSGGSDGGTLTAAEATDLRSVIPPQRLLSGFYLNELVLKLLPEAEPSEGIFGAYLLAVGGLAESAGEEVVLRRFEFALLGELGYAPDFGGLDPDGVYDYRPGLGFRRPSGAGGGVGGATDREARRGRAERQAVRGEDPLRSASRRL